MSQRFGLLAASFLVSACTSVAVKPVNRESHQLEHVCIQDNPRVIVTDFEESIERGLQRHGLTSERYSGDKPPDHCVYTLSYVAHQNWDIATYLWQADVQLRKGAEIVGTAEYHLKGKGGLALNKWASVESKMGPVMDQLLARFPRVQI